jgi:hypothetical protein
MRHTFNLAICLLFTVSVFSQNVVALQDPVSSKNFNSEKYSSIRGTPFLVDKWIKGNVTTPKGVYQSLELKFNVYDNALFFNKNDESFELQDDIVSFTLMPKPDDAGSYMIYKRGISGADLHDNQYVQVLLEGNMSLYKLDVKQLSEMSEINAGVVKNFTNNAKYYIGKNHDLQFIKINKTEILNALKDKQDKIQAFINEKKFSFRKDADLIEVLKYYNSL